MTLSARTYISTLRKWSALNRTSFSIDSEPASAGNLVISEFHYHPAEPATAAELEVSRDRDDYEFIELHNVGPRTIDLTGVFFNEGISYAFEDHTLLAANARLVLARDLAAFTARYGSSTADLVNGEYSGRLSNDGEQLTLAKIGVGALHALTYNDQAPWPTEADGSGSSLVLFAPDSAPDHALPANWRPSNTIGGTPGREN
jgi:hypothetical protein